MRVATKLLKKVKTKKATKKNITGPNNVNLYVKLISMSDFSVSFDPVFCDFGFIF